MFIIENMQNTEKIHKKSSINLHLREYCDTFVCVYTHIHLQNKIWLVYGFISYFFEI